MEMTENNHRCPGHDMIEIKEKTYLTACPRTQTEVSFAP